MPRRGAFGCAGGPPARHGERTWRTSIAVPGAVHPAGRLLGGRVIGVVAHALGRQADAALEGARRSGCRAPGSRAIARARGRGERGGARRAVVARDDRPRGDGSRGPPRRRAMAVAPPMPPSSAASGTSAAVTASSTIPRPRPPRHMGAHALGAGAEPTRRRRGSSGAPRSSVDGLRHGRPTVTPTPRISLQ